MDELAQKKVAEAKKAMATEVKKVATPTKKDK
jgi:hypothetical protein